VISRVGGVSSFRRLGRYPSLLGCVMILVTVLGLVSQLTLERFLCHMGSALLSSRGRRHAWTVGVLTKEIEGCLNRDAFGVDLHASRAAVISANNSDEETCLIVARKAQGCNRSRRI
jgi:hypothetical protein